MPQTVKSTSKFLAFSISVLELKHMLQGLSKALCKGLGTTV